MSTFDASTYLATHEGPNSCGRDIEATGELYALEDASREPDEPGIKGQEPVDLRNWSDIRRQAEGLFKDSRHLRVACHLARALLRTDGLVSFCACVRLISDLIERQWAHLYPPLDGSDATERLNILRELASTSMLADLRAAPLLRVKGLGTFSLGDLLVAKGLQKPRAGTTPPSPQVVFAALENAPLEDVKAVVTAAKGAQQALQHIASQVGALTGEAFALPGLAQAFARIDELLGPQVAAAQAISVSAPEQAPIATTQVSSAQGLPSANGAATSTTEMPMKLSPATMGEVQTREEVATLIDKICRYYERHEPSSPVPLLLQRARRLSMMSFMEIMKDMADKGLPQIEAVAGKEGKA